MKMESGVVFAAALLTNAAWGQCEDPVYEYHGEQQSDFLGLAVGDAGDVDGDGYGDFVVGVPYDDFLARDTGTVLVYSGATGALLSSMHGQARDDRLGHHVDGAGDIDGDGFDDIIAGAPNADVNGGGTGSAYVFSGATGAVIHAWHGQKVGDNLGDSVSVAGDVDGDGVNDLLVGARISDGNGFDSGSAFVFSGATGEQLYVWHGEAGGDKLGGAVRDAGDVNGDGVDDVIVGARENDMNGESAGAAYVFSGATGAVLHAWYGQAAGDEFGGAVGGAGDVDGDGFPDLLVAAPESDTEVQNAGRVYLFSGATGLEMASWHGAAAEDDFGTAVSGVGDADGDGVPDVLVGAHGSDAYASNAGSAYLFSGATGLEIASWHGRAVNDGFGAVVSHAGDIDGDGLAEVIVGAGFADGDGRDSGSAYVFDPGCADCPGDFNGDGFADTRDVLDFLNSWTSGDATADCDGNGAVDTRDLVCFLNVWAAGC